MPTAVFGQTTMSMLPRAAALSSVERIVQLDFKVARTFRFGRFSILPTFEVFNVNNSDAIISYISTNVLWRRLPGAEQHHAGPDVWRRRGDALVRD